MAVYSPMARSLPDLVYFTRSFIEMKPWTYDQACYPIPWRMKDVEREYSTGHRRWAVMPTDGVVNPSLACQRALKMTVEALEKHGDEVIEFTPEMLPSHPKDILYLASQLLNSDGTKTYGSHFSSFFENSDPKGAPERPGSIVRVRPVVIHKDLVVATVTKDGAAELPDISRCLYPT